jgi:hypothetical protein
MLSSCRAGAHHRRRGCPGCFDSILVSSQQRRKQRWRWRRCCSPWEVQVACSCTAAVSQLGRNALQPGSPLCAAVKGAGWLLLDGRVPDNAAARCSLGGGGGETVLPARCLWSAAGDAMGHTRAIAPELSHISVCRVKGVTIATTPPAFGLAVRVLQACFTILQACTAVW